MTEFLLHHARKATGAFLIATAGTLGTSLLDGQITVSEVLAAVGTGLVAAAGVYRLNNSDDGKVYSR